MMCYYDIIESYRYTSLWSWVPNMTRLPFYTMANRNLRADHSGPFHKEFVKNRKKILQTQDVCAICGRPVDKTLRYPNRMAPTVDHILPLNKGGHPSDINNLQLAHFICNRLKSDTIIASKPIENQQPKILQSLDWKTV